MFRTNRSGVDADGSSRAPTPRVAIAAIGLPITLMAMIALPLASAATGPAKSAAGHVMRAAAPANANWPVFHGNAQLTGVSHDTSISSSNASQLGVRWMTHTFGPVLSSPVTHFRGKLHKQLAYVANGNG